MAKLEWRSLLNLSPHAGRGQTAQAGRVKGTLRELHWQLHALIEAPHPNPLPVRTGRGRAPGARRQHV
jgi:hypothetical protein